jgi:hypothetical protein
VPAPPYLVHFRSWRCKSRGRDERRTEFAVSAAAIGLLAVIAISALVAAGWIPAGAAADAIARLGLRAFRL